MTQILKCPRCKSNKIKVEWIVPLFCKNNDFENGPDEKLIDVDDFIGDEGARAWCDKCHYGIPGLDLEFEVADFIQEEVILWD